MRDRSYSRRRLAQQHFIRAGISPLGSLFEASG
jgi:hypothetical protein